MNKQFDINIHSAEWVVKEVQNSLKTYYNLSPKEQDEMLPHLKYVFGRLKFELKELKKIIPYES